MDDKETLVEKLRETVDINIDNDQFGVEELARNLAMSRSQLHRKLVSATGKSISQFIREHRLITTVYMLVAIQFEESDLIKFYGDKYRE